jgi:hypothetical protein
MIGWVGAAWAADGHLDALVGSRTEPDAALEQPTEWEPEVEPAAVGGLVGAVTATAGPVWGGAEGSAWGFLPEGDAGVLALGPRAGIGGDAGPARLELAARYDAQWYPLTSRATNGRAEGLGSASLELGAVAPGITVQGIDRRYVEPRWSFSSAEGDVQVRVDPEGQPVWGRAVVGGQVNQSQDVGGSQLRVRLELGFSARHWNLTGGWQWIDAFQGERDDVQRSLFTPLGDYVEDADAVSNGGFVQHRVDLGGSGQVGPWVVRGSALGRYRTYANGTHDATVHAQVDLERQIADPWRGLLTVGASSVQLAAGARYLDLYGLAGISYRFD